MIEFSSLFRLSPLPITCDSRNPKKNDFFSLIQQVKNDNLTSSSSKQNESHNAFRGILVAFTNILSFFSPGDNQAFDVIQFLIKLSLLGKINNFLLLANQERKYEVILEVLCLLEKMICYGTDLQIGRIIDNDFITTLSIILTDLSPLWQRNKTSLRNSCGSASGCSTASLLSVSVITEKMKSLPSPSSVCRVLSSDTSSPTGIQSVSPVLPPSPLPSSSSQSCHSSPSLSACLSQSTLEKIIIKICDILSELSSGPLYHQIAIIQTNHLLCNLFDILLFYPSLQVRKEAFFAIPNLIPNFSREELASELFLKEDSHVKEPYSSTASSVSSLLPSSYPSLSDIIISKGQPSKSSSNNVAPPPSPPLEPFLLIRKQKLSFYLMKNLHNYSLFFQFQGKEKSSEILILNSCYEYLLKNNLV
jgi:hypothetical protein